MLFGRPAWAVSAGPCGLIAVVRWSGFDLLMALAPAVMLQCHWGQLTHERCFPPSDWQRQRRGLVKEAKEEMVEVHRKRSWRCLFMQWQGERRKRSKRELMKQFSASSCLFPAAGRGNTARKQAKTSFRKSDVTLSNIININSINIYMFCKLSSTGLSEDIWPSEVVYFSLFQALVLCKYSESKIKKQIKKNLMNEWMNERNIYLNGFLNFFKHLVIFTETQIYKYKIYSSIILLEYLRRLFLSLVCCFSVKNAKYCLIWNKIFMVLILFYYNRIFM